MPTWAVVAIVGGTGALIALGSYYVLPDPAATVAKACWRSWRFEPQADITAYELATIEQNIHGIGGLGSTICESEDKRMPPGVARHFRRIN